MKLAIQIVYNIRTILNIYLLPHKNGREETLKLKGTGLLPSIAVCCIHIYTKIKQELYNVVMASTYCIMQRGNSFIIGFAGIINLLEQNKIFQHKPFTSLKIMGKPIYFQKFTSYMILCTRSNSPSKEASSKRAKGLNFTLKPCPVLSELGFFRLVRLVWVEEKTQLSFQMTRMSNHFITS